MRIISILALLACLCACGDPEPAKTLDASKELRPHMEKVYAAWGTLDLAKVAPFYAKETGRAFFDVAPLKYASWADYAAGVKAMSSDWKSVKIEISPDFQAHSNGPIAWVTCTANITTEMKDGKTESMKARITELLQKDKDSWIIIHEHVSVPMVAPTKPTPEKKKPAPAKKKSRKR
ncbi:MAG TPA: nuclear transport factor 2 family protein [Paludibaculum sp.]|jgi:ketosteroid isomerase-like protein